MADRILVNYISRGRDAGVPDEALRAALLEVGWSLGEINLGLAEAGSHLPIINTEPTAEEIAESLSWSETHRGIFVLVIVTLLFVMMMAVVVISYKFLTRPTNLTDITHKMLDTFSKVSGFNYEGSLDLYATHQSLVGGNATSAVSVPTVMLIEHSTSTGVFNGTIQTPHDGRPSFLISFKINSDQGGRVFGAEIDNRLIEDEWFVFASRLDRLNQLDLSSLAGFWLSVTPADIASLGGQAQIFAPSVNQLLVWRGNIARSQSFSLIEESGRENLAGINTVKYSFVWDVKQSQSWLKDVTNLFGDDIVVDELKTLSSNKITGYVWLGVSDYLPYQVEVASPFADDLGEEKINGILRINLRFNDFNRPTRIVRPTTARSLSEVFGEGLNISGSTTSTTTSSRP